MQQRSQQPVVSVEPLIVELAKDISRKVKNFLCHSNTMPNCELDRRTILCLHAPGFQRQVFKHVKFLSERSNELKEKKKNQRSVLVAESAYNSQNTQFGLVMSFFRYSVVA